MRVSVKVKYTYRGQQPGTVEGMDRPDLGFSVAGGNLREVKAKAKAEFREKHGKDIAIRACNFLDRNTLQMAVCHPDDVKPSDIPRDMVGLTRRLKPAPR